TPVISFGNWLWPSRRRQLSSAACASLKTMAIAVLFERHPLERTVRCRTVANVLSMGLVTGMKIAVPACSAGIGLVPAYGATIRTRGTGSTLSGQADTHHEPRARVSSWPPLRPTRLRCERGSVVVVLPTAPATAQERSRACDV